ncbi:MAG: HEPN domain-containing protein [Bacteroidales bacterium]|nr:HEPN domain-containing protein [Bacteroidales bacterium]
MAEERKDKLDYEKSINHWIESSDRDFLTMTNLLKSKDYSWSLFLGHLVIEKLLKALVVKETNEFPKPIHDLARLANKGKLKCSGEQLDMLDVITTFNISARYEDFKLEFYRRCTKDFTETWVNNIKELRQWIKSQL